MIAWWLQLVGLIVGFAGAFSLAISQSRSKQASEGRPGRGEVSHVVLEYPLLWTYGLWLLFGGFVLQFVGLVSMGPPQ